LSIRELAVQVDERLADLYEASFGHTMDAMNAAETIRRYSSQTREEFRASRWATPTYGPWSGTLTEAIAEVEAEATTAASAFSASNAKRVIAAYRFATAALAQIKVETAELDACWREEGRWTRAFLVINSNGHVHNGMDCSTCYDSTRYEWLTAYSAADETEIVGAAGEMACTVCYPTAPAEVLNRPANLISKTRAEKDAAKAQRAAEKAAREAKKLAKAIKADGTTLTIPDDFREGRFERIDTEYAARREWNSDEDSLRYDSSRGGESQTWRRPLWAERQALIEGALADKYGVTPTEMRAQLLAKFAKRRPQ
jgi:hypothetical protein